MIANQLTPFGYKMTWYAVHTGDAVAVAEAIGLKQRNPVHWNEGIAAAYGGLEKMDGMLFISPPICGWVLIVGYDQRLDFQTISPGHQFNSIIIKLSEKFGQAQFFGTHRVVDWHAWARAKAGKVERAFSYLGEQGEITLNLGPCTTEENELKMNFDGVAKFPDEEDVLNLAAAWSVDPQLRNVTEISSEGIIGKL